MTKSQLSLALFIFASVACAAGAALTLLSIWTPALLSVGIVVAFIGLLLVLFPVLFSAWRAILQPSKKNVATRADLASTAAELHKVIEKQRSVVEWRLGRSLADIHKQQRLAQLQLDALTPRHEQSESGKGAGKHRILLMTSNGAGLGHLTRMLAIAEQFQRSESAFFSLSAGSTLAALRGFETQYFPSFESGDHGITRETWRRRFSIALSATLDSYQPDVVVFDGTYVYETITDACRARGIPLMWMQRGCWKPEIDAESLQRHDAGLACDAVVIPGDYGCDETVDTGSAVQPSYVAPVALVNRGDLLSRESACEELGLDPAQQHVLIQLGAGKIGSIEHSRTTAVESVTGLGTPWNAVTPISPLTTAPVHVEGATSIRAYPVAKYANAFSFAIVAAGYNSAQECVGLGLPAVFVPNPDTLTDDQVRRALALQERGYGLTAASSDELRTAVETLASEATLRRFRQQLAEAPEPRGAGESAAIIETWVDDCKRVILRSMQG